MEPSHRGIADACGVVVSTPHRPRPTHAGPAPATWYRRVLGSMLREWPAFEALAKSFAEGDPCLRIAGLTGAARALAVAELLQTHPRPALVVVGAVADAHRWTQDLKLFGTTALEFPSPEPRLWRGGHHREADAERAMIARRLAVAEPVTIVSTPAALNAPLLSRAEFAQRTLRLATGDRLDRELLLEALERCGYERVETVVAVGQWSLRGGIVDVFSPSQASPARLEFFGDDVESIRLFDPTSQRSVVSLDELLVLPLVPEDDEHERGARLLDYLPAAAPVVIDVPKLLDGPTEEAPADPPLRERLAGRQLVELTLVAGTSSAAPGVSAASEFTLETHEVPRFTGRFNQLTVELGRWRDEGFRVRLTAADDRQAEHLRQILREHGIEAVVAASLDGAESLAVVVGECSAGFSVPSLGVIVLTEGEVFGSRRRSLRRPKYQRGAALTAFTDLAIGDVVVHEDHGLGRYLGLQTMKIGDREGDFLLLEYAEANRLYLPVERLDRISKYLGADTDAARLDRLGGASWQRVQEPLRAVSGQGRAAVAFPLAQGAEGGRRGPAAGHRRRRDRHAPALVEGRHVQEPWPDGHRRGAPVRRRPQGADETAARLGGRARPHGHAHPANPLHVALRRAGHVGDRDRAAGSAPGRDGHPPLQQGGHQGGARARAGARWPGVLRPQPRPVASLDGEVRSGAGARRARDHGPRPDAGARARGRDGEVRHGPGRRARLDGDRRVRPRHSRVQHDHRQSRRSLRPGPALPATRAGGTGAPAGVRLSAGPRGR